MTTGSAADWPPVPFRRYASAMGVAAWARRMWEGEEPLALAFWQYGIVFGLAINVAHLFLVWAVISAGASGAVIVAVNLIPWPYNLLVAWGVWRAAERYEGPALWATGARAVIVPWTVVACVI
jgi:hypothetical protein